MKKLLVIALCALVYFAFMPQAECYTRGKSHVKSYTTKSGKRVKAHYKTTYRKGAGGTRKYKKRR